MCSTVVGEAEAGSWGAEASIEEEGKGCGGGGGSDASAGGDGGVGGIKHSVNKVDSAAAVPAAAKGKGGEVEAKLRQRLLASMMGKSKAKVKAKD